MFNVCACVFLLPCILNASCEPFLTAALSPLLALCADRCPDTKAKRDECVVVNGEEKCTNFIEAHKECLRKEGFTVK